ncbi:hypothetical protein ACIRG5_21085 [Lentzea sp. NPDC102401]|uniref:hypothetical protein n=1 Tax=Lentzea sp. NPDC102401 TaxID=3364128 RepID=UPI0037FF75C1
MLGTNINAFGDRTGDRGYTRIEFSCQTKLDDLRGHLYSAPNLRFAEKSRKF